MDIRSYFQSFESKGKVLGLTVDNVGVAWTTVLVTLVYYLISKYPDLSVWDSPLIALAAIQQGLGHPPGYPLHTLLGAITTNLPGIEPLLGVKLLSIIPGALMCIPILSLAAQMRDPKLSKPTSMGSWFAAAFVVALCVHQVLWDPATRVEVYALASFLAIWGVARLGDALNSLKPPPTSTRHSGPRGFFIAGLSLGASASVHPVVAAVTATAALAAITKTAIKITAGRRAILNIVAGGLTGLLPYGWIPIVAARTDRLVWGKPTDLTSIWHFLSARDFAVNVGPDMPTILSQVFEWIGWSVISWTLPFALMGFAGWLLFGKHGSVGRSAPVALVLAVLAICTNRVWVPENPDYLGYLCGPLAVCAAGGAALLSHTAFRKPFGLRLLTGVCLFFVFGSMVFTSPSVLTRTRHRDRSARLQAMGALQEIGDNGILMAGSDQLLWPLMYIQEIEHVRRDVVILTPGLASTSWYWNHIYQLHPTLRLFAINGPGGKLGRIRRFLAAHPDRRLSFESVGMASRANATIYGVGWLLLDRPVDLDTTEKISAQIDRTATTIATGSPTGVGTLSLVSYLRGEALWRLGHAKAAYRALLAGVPPSLRPSVQIPETHWDQVPALRQMIPPGVSSTRGLGEPHRNIGLSQYLADPEKVKQINRQVLPPDPQIQKDTN